MEKVVFNGDQYHLGEVPPLSVAEMQEIAIRMHEYGQTEEAEHWKQKAERAKKIGRLAT